MRQRKLQGSRKNRHLELPSFRGIIYYIKINIIDRGVKANNSSKSSFRAEHSEVEKSISRQISPFHCVSSDSYRNEMTVFIQSLSMVGIIYYIKINIIDREVKANNSSKSSFRAERSEVEKSTSRQISPLHCVSVEMTMLFNYLHSILPNAIDPSNFSLLKSLYLVSPLTSCTSPKPSIS